MQTEKPVRIAAALLAAAAVVLCASIQSIAPESSLTVVIPSIMMLFVAVWSLWKKPQKTETKKYQ